MEELKEAILALEIARNHFEEAEPCFISAACAELEAANRRLVAVIKGVA